MNAHDALQHAWISKTSQGSEEQIQASASVVVNLKQFTAMNKLKKASLNVISTMLDGNGMKKLKNLFMSMDENNDGTLSVGELKEGLQRAGVAIPQDLEQMMDNIDTDGSGVIDYTEFLAATLDKRKYTQEDLCFKAFK